MNLWVKDKLKLSCKKMVVHHHTCQNIHILRIKNVTGLTIITSAIQMCVSTRIIWSTIALQYMNSDRLHYIQFGQLWRHKEMFG